jgi:GNAT superfamily N-acetyltransferase
VGTLVPVQAAIGGRPTLAGFETCDSELLKAFLDRLSSSSVYRRFFSPAVKFEQFAASLRTNGQFERDAIVALDCGEVVGVAQYSRRAGSDGADMAIVVADAWQRQGVGRELVAALADRAVAAGVTIFAVSIQGDNFAALGLLRQLAPGVRLAFAAGVGEAVIHLAAGSAT